MGARHFLGSSLGKSPEGVLASQVFLREAELCLETRLISFQFRMGAAVKVKALEDDLVIISDFCHDLTYRSPLKPWQGVGSGLSQTCLRFLELVH